MKEIEKVSIAGIAFMLDTDAFAILNEYFEKLQRIYQGNADGAEIIADIEARITEIILSRQDPGVVVNKKLIAEVIQRMGLPEEESAGQADAPTTSETFPRRLYRNPDGAKLGGVCSGIATFFGVDPVWVRLGLFAPLLLTLLFAPINGLNLIHSFMTSLTGVAFLGYFILWMAVPMASTPRQKLEMRGEKITASSIENNIRREFSSYNPSPRSHRSASVWAEIVYIFGRVALFGIKAIATILAITLCMTSVAIVSGIAAAFIADEKVFNVDGIPVSEIFAGLSGMTPEMYVVLTLLIALIPVILLTNMLFNLIFDKRLNVKFISIAGGIWLITMVYWGVITLRNTEVLRQGVHQIEMVGERYDDRYDDYFDDDYRQNRNRSSRRHTITYGTNDKGVTVIEISEDSLKQIKADTLTIKP